MQSLTDGPFVLKRLLFALWKELRTATLLGLACGAVVGSVVFLWRGELLLAGTIASAIWASMIVACLLGVAFPALLHAAKADPKIAAGPVVLGAAASVRGSGPRPEAQPRAANITVLTTPA